MIQKAGLHKTSCNDYPGHVAATVFLSECNLTCPFCHNPELTSGFTNPTDLLPMEEIFDFLKKRRPVLDGVCISGGEPLMFQDTKEMIHQIKALGYRVKVDTNGTFPDRLEKILKDIDYVAMDIKTTFSKYGVTGLRDTEPIKKSVNLIAKHATDYEFRTTIIPDFCGMEEIKEICTYFPSNSKYTLNKFNPVKTLDPSWQNKKSFSFNEALTIKQTAQKMIPNVKLQGYSSETTDIQKPFYEKDL